jgi:hypothetical protein
MPRIHRIADVISVFTPIILPRRSAGLAMRFWVLMNMKP